MVVASDEPLDLSSDRRLRSGHRRTVMDETGEVATPPELERTTATKWTRVPARVLRRSTNARYGAD
jgi:hypothetical protein